MALVVFGVTYLVAAVIYAIVMVLSVGERARSFHATSARLLPPLGIIFGLFVAFTAAQVKITNGPTRRLTAKRVHCEQLWFSPPVFRERPKRVCAAVT